MHAGFEYAPEENRMISPYILYTDIIIYTNGELRARDKKSEIRT